MEPYWYTLLPPRLYITPRGAPEGMEEVTQSPGMRGLMFDNHPLQVETSVKDVYSDGDSLPSISPFQGNGSVEVIDIGPHASSFLIWSPPKQVTSGYGWNKPLPEETGSINKWRRDGHSTASYVSSLRDNPSDPAGDWIELHTGSRLTLSS